ncbi:coiled-coil domain-containing protein 178 isoform X2 [Melanotaenia boesemani]|uniref:coiled-coil domain-containing protein 178 isoform X2 n=1 Tax=Melanotaenia boesemani TaxID=1250792 RepID=UPI001C0506C6|nr:coiled-coil domain-containing protein 178 isoform X2 [Melanotaenia boesemani]
MQDGENRRAMPDVEPPGFPSREGRPGQQDQADLQALCSGRNRTCALLNSPSPCVNSAIYHIHEMKKIVENWCQHGKPHYSKTSRFQSRDSDSDSVKSTDLYVEGTAISARESYPLPPLKKKINDILSEVMDLIQRLEVDRQNVEKALHKEKQRKSLLKSKVDSIALREQIEHSFAVQQEQEACLRDITELKRHLKLETQKLDQVQEKLSDAQLLNQHLQDDINSAKKQVPTVSENLDLQKSIINSIKTAQAEANEVCSKIQSDLLLAQKELKTTERDANKEKMSLDHVLLVMKNRLTERLEELNQLRMDEKCLLSEIQNAEDIIVYTEQKCTIINQKIPEILELEKTEKNKISQLNLQIENEMQKNRTLEEKLTLLAQNIEKTKMKGETEVSCLEELLHKKREAFGALCKENMEYEQTIEDYKLKILQSEEAVKQMQEEMKQMCKKITDNDEQWEKALEELTQVVAQHSDIQAKLEEQEQLTFMEEHRARAEVEKLKKDLTGHRTTMETLKTQCVNLNEELKEQQRSSEQTNQQLQKELEVASLTTNALEAKVEKIKRLTEHLEMVQCEHNETLIKLGQEKKLTCDKIKAAQDLHCATIKKHDSAVGRITELTTRIEEYRDASDKIEKSVERMPEMVAELQSDLNLLEFKNKSAAHIMSTLQSDINNWKQRTQRSMQTHTALVTTRKKQMENTKKGLKNALEENKQLAQKYESLQKILMDVKEESLSALSERNHVHESFHYYTQLSLLQKRMHKALEKYFEQRNLYSQAELDRCQALSQENDQKIKAVEEGLSEEIQLISAFLQSLQDDSTTTDDAGVNKQASPDAAGSNE